MKKIDVRIPYEPDGKLGWDYNRIMEETPHDWVLFLDHDIFLALNPNWYHICQKVIENQPKVGIFTCKTNAKHSNTGQQDVDAPGSDSIAEHQEYAKVVWDRDNYSCTPVSKISGFFMLVSKKAWKDAGGFPAKGMFKEDWDFTRKVTKSGYKLMIINGLYVYHMKKRIGSWVEGESSTKEIKDREVKK